MKTIRELTTEAKVKELSIESNRRLGKEILAYDHIEIEVDKPQELLARVGVTNGEKRKVEIEAEGDTLSWKCSCGSASGKNDVFCKHCVAAVLRLANPKEEVAA